MKEITNRTENEILENLTSIVKEFDVDKENYLLSYPIFINYFSSINRIEKEHLVIGISFTYSWMPTILEFKNNDFHEPIKILNRAKNNEELLFTDLKLLKGIFNNSLVGTSKLLHFINPEKYAIWDSRVFRFLNTSIKTPYSYHVENIESYFEYLKLLDRITELPFFDKFYQKVISKLGCSVTKYRAMELMMFRGGLRNGLLNSIS